VTRPPRAAVCLVSLAVAFTGAEAQQTAAPPPAPQSPPATNDILNDTNLLLVEVVLDQLTVTDSLAAFNGPDGLLIPVGELSRLLDVDMTVLPGERRVTGNIGEARRPILVDMATATIRIDGKSDKLQPGDMVVGLDDIYVRAALLERLLPVQFSFDESALRISLKALEPLPIQSRLERLGRLRSLQPDSPDQRDSYHIPTPNRLFSIPALDVSLEAGGQQQTPHYPYRYDLRAGGDLLYGNFQGFLGSNEAGKPISTRFLLERRDPNGHALGILGVTRASAGDVYTPTLAIGPRSLGGRGFSFSTAPLGQQSVFGRIDLRGELPIGYDIELYVNDVLRSGQSTPVQGRYEFLNIPLVRGINVIRIVSFGPRGERSEDVRVVSVGGGQIPKGTLTVAFGAAQQEKPLIDLQTEASGAIVDPGVGRLRLAADVLYGVSEQLTLNAGAAVYSPTGLAVRRMATLGIRTSLAGYAVQINGAMDDQSGKGVSVAIAGRPFGVSTIVRHAEYRDGFVDETIPRGGGGQALKRSSEVDFDLAVKAWGKQSLPVSLRLSRDEFVNGEVDLGGSFRTSTAIGGVFISAGLDYDSIDPVSGSRTNQLTGVLGASSFAAFKWQLRTNVDYTLIPTARLRAVTVIGDRELSPRTALRLGVGHSFQDDRDTTLQAGATRHLGFADLTLGSEYSAPTNRWRVGLQMAFSLLRDPLDGRYLMRRSGAASGGNLALQAFVDRNGNNLYDKGEVPVPGVSVDGGLDRRVTDAKGQALVTNLGYGTTAQVRTGIDDVDLDNVVTPPSILEFTPRAGTTAVAMYPIQPKGEVMVHLFVHRRGGLVGLSAVQLIVMRDGAESSEAVTEYDGSVLFDALRPGDYALQLAPEQASRLKMQLEKPIMFKIGADGGALPDVTGIVLFENEK
jgi:hypothetical protein